MKISRILSLFLIVFSGLLFVSPTAVFSSASLPNNLGNNESPRLITEATSPYFAGFYSNNIANMSTVSVMKGSWIVPDVTCEAQASVGISITMNSGYSGATAGTSIDCYKGVTTTSYYYAFYVIYSWSNTYEFFVNWNPSPGDKISASIVRTKVTFFVNIEDVTKGLTFTQNCADPPAGVNITNPCSLLGYGSGNIYWVTSVQYFCSPTCVEQPLANFGTVTFRNSGAIIGGHPRTVRSSSDNLIRYTTVSENDSSLILARPSDLSNDGTSFSVVWKNAGP